VLAAALVRGSRPAEGVRAAAEVAVKAAGAPNGSGWAGCAAMAAAAVGDPGRAAAALSKIASSDAELRAWGAVNAVLDGQAALRQAVYPWSAVAGSPAVAEAMKRIDATRARVRAEAAKILEGL